MTSQRTALPPRTDLTTRRKRVVAKAAVQAEDIYERLKSRVLVEVTPPKDDPFYRAPDQLEAFRPGEVERRIVVAMVEVFDVNLSGLVLDMTNFATWIDSANDRPPEYPQRPIGVAASKPAGSKLIAARMPSSTNRATSGYAPKACCGPLKSVVTTAHPRRRACAMNGSSSWSPRRSV